MGKWTRRAFITAGSLLGGGLVLGVGGVLLAPNRLGIRESGKSDSAMLTTWLRITPAGEIIVAVPHCEMGQGAQTGLALMLADELDAAWTDVRIEEAPALDNFANGHVISGYAQRLLDVPDWLTRALEYASYRVGRLMPLQVTGGSASIVMTGQFGMRVAGAAGRAMLIEAAADLWSLPVDQLSAAESVVTHPPSGRTASFGELADRAAMLKPPAQPRLKTRDEFKLIGKSVPRADFPSKVTGQATYGVDVKLPDMLVATVRATPIPGQSLNSVDHAPALAIDGVHRVVELHNAVAVIAEGYPQALRGVRSLEPVFTTAENPPLSADELMSAHAQALENDKPGVDHRLGEGEKALSRAARIVEAEYFLPYLAHATMEPMAATALCQNGRCEVWAGTQDPLNARRVAAKAAGLDDEKVTFHNLHSGGGFGRRLPGGFDYIEQAVAIAREMSPRPVKLIWSREEDMTHDYYRPAMMARCRGGLGADGQLQCWVSRFTGGGDFGAGRSPYAMPHQEILTHSLPEPLRHGAWRSVGHSQQGFIIESFVDELATAAGQDPLAWRLELLTDHPRHSAVLRKVSEMARWSSPRPAGHGLGVAVVESFGSVVAEVAEVSVDKAGKIRVHQVWAAVDCGLVVHPDQALAQIQGGILFGLSAALYQQITLSNGAVKQRNFPDYPALRLADAPRLSVEFLQTDSPMGGLGEPGVPPIAPALANAVFAATGQRRRRLPLQPV